MTTSSLKVRTKRKVHPNSLKNLIPTQYPKGVSGNTGSGNGYSLTAALKHTIGKPLKKPKDDAPVRDHIVYATILGAINCEPSSAHLREVWDRVDGPVNKDTTSNINAIQINIVFDNPPDQAEVEAEE